MANPTPPTPTATVGAPTATLQAIETKVRRLTRSPSTAQLSQADLDNYINTFLVYDFPEHLRTYNLKRPFTFFCNTGQDVYPTDEASFGGVTTNMLYNFQNLYLTVHPPFFIGGFPALFTQSRDQFFGIYPMINSIASIGASGDGVTTNFTGVINSQQSIVPPGSTQYITLLQNNVLFSSSDSNGNGLSLADIPIIDSATGNPIHLGNLYDPASAAYQAALQTPPIGTAPYIPGTGGILVGNTINYITGAFTATFTNAPGPGIPINSQSVPQNLSIPQAIMFYNNEFTVRPVPDQPYRITFDVFQRPTALLAAGQSPELEEYWQLVAYGAAKKIFEDRMDLDSVQMIMPEYNQQMRLCLRRTIVQNTNERTATIYTDQVGGSQGWGWGQTGGGGSSF